MAWAWEVQSLQVQMHKLDNSYTSIDIWLIDLMSVQLRQSSYFMILLILTK